MTQKTIDVRNQVTLSFEKSFRFCRKGISYRLFRSSLTLAVVVVAVAFFTVLLSESLMVRATSRGVQEEMAAAREADTLLVHLFQRYTSRDLSAKLAGMHGDAAKISEFARVAGLSKTYADDLVNECRVEQILLHFFRTLSPGKRAILVGKHSGRSIFQFLADPEEWQSFLAAVGKMRSERLPVSDMPLRTFIENHDAFLAALQKAREGRERTVTTMESKLDVLTGGADAATWLGTAMDSEAERWRAIVTESGFDLDAATMERVRGILRVSALEQRIARLLQTPEKREAWKVSLQTMPGLEDKLAMLKKEKVGEILGDAFSNEERDAVADRFVRLRQLRALASKLPPVASAVVARPRFLDGRQMFLVVISFLVCMVGIANAMLMSITERFREIATMKCLGATDGFILKQFLIEAAIQGVIGGSVGMVIGIVISVLKSALLLGGIVFTYFPALEMVYCAFGTVAVGIVLAMLASIYPSRAAARMAPMDAMRLE